MSDFQPMPMTSVRHRGYFDYDKLVQTWQDWFWEQGFTYPMYGEQSLHPHKISDFGWEDRTQFFADKKVTDYVQFKIELRVILQNMQQVEVVQDGKKRKLTEGLIVIEIMPSIRFDWQERFEKKGKLVEWMGQVLEKYILKYKIGDYWEDMIIDMSVALAKALRQTLEQEII